MSDPEIPVGLANSQFYIQNRKDWAIHQENYRHDQAMYGMGELAMFVILWRLEDHRLGYVRRCPRCYENADADLSAAAKAYNQPTQNRCPMCYGTTFEGGVRAKLIRPTIFTDTDDQEVPTEHGMNYPQNLTVETTSDFRYRAGDFVFRSDGSRWRLANPQRVQLRTGFGHPSQNMDSIGYGPTIANLEDKTSVAWMIPPNEDDLKVQLQESSRYPTYNHDVVNGPLIPKGWTD